jgi:hypothetical protein
MLKLLADPDYLMILLGAALVSKKRYIANNTTYSMPLED